MGSFVETCKAVSAVDWSALAAFFAAGIAGVAAWMNSQTMREARKASVDIGVMNLREKWIWDLRKQMAEFIALALSLSNLRPADPSYKGQKLRFNQLYSLIPFMMDPETDKSALQALKKLVKPAESQQYYISFKDIQSQMGEVETRVAKHQALGKELAYLETLFHSYLRYHWINLQHENIKPHAKNH